MNTHYVNEVVDVSVLERSKPGNYCCGDAHTVIHTNEYTICAVVDGLGSGEGANRSSVAAIEKIQSLHQKPLARILDSCNEEMIQKRGVVMTIIKFDYATKQVLYTNVGNVSFVMYLPDGRTIQPIPTRGYLSGRKQHAKVQNYPYCKGSTFALYSDGVIKRPSKDLLIRMNSTKEVVEQSGSTENYAIDDATLLVGQIKKG